MYNSTPNVTLLSAVTSVRQATIIVIVIIIVNILCNMQLMQHRNTQKYENEKNSKQTGIDVIGITSLLCSSTHDIII